MKSAVTLLPSSSTIRSKLLQVLAGPLPPTLLLLPFVAASLVGLLIATVWKLATAGISDAFAGFPWSLVFWEIGAMLGIIGLWLAILVSPAYLAERPAQRRAIVAMLVVGLVMAVSWLLEMRSHSAAYGLSTWTTWIGLLGGPICVAGYRLHDLVTHRRDAAQTGSGSRRDVSKRKQPS